VNSRVVLGCIFAAGVGLLVWVAPRAHPAALWNVRTDRQQAVIKTREISAALGVNTAGWSAAVSSDNAGKRGYFQEKHPDVAAARRYTPVLAKVALSGPGGGDRILAGVSSAGDINSWERKLAMQPGPQTPPPDPAAALHIAEGALASLAGPDAAQFQRAADPEPPKGGLAFAWTRSGPLPERIEAAVTGNTLVKASRQPVYPEEVDRALRDRKKVRNWFDGAAAICIYIIGIAIVLFVYVYWLARRAIRHRFAIAVAANAAVWGLIYWFNVMLYGERYDHAASGSSVIGNFFGGALLVLLLMILYMTLAGAAEAIAPRARMATLRSVFSAAAFNRRAGFSVFAGAMCAPLIVALPLLISSWRLMGSERTGDYDANLIYAAWPGLAAAAVPLSTALLGIFGFAPAFLARHIRKPAIAFAVLAFAGVLTLAVNTPPSETAPAAFLLSGAVVFAAYYLLLVRVDLLAVLASGWSAQVLWNACALWLQPARSLHVSGITVVVYLLLGTAVAALVAWRGRELAAENIAEPAIATSQREALMAEFSIAHRVQQEMLPERPPEIPGCTVSASCHPAREVGGDLFEFLKLPDGRWTIAVGDVSGKGVPAALYMTLTKGLLIATTQDSSDPLEIIHNVNGHIHAATERKTFVTLALGAFDPETRSFDHVRAGHNPIVWRRPGEGATSLLNAPGLGLGIVSDRLFRRSTRLDRIQLNSGDALVFYSDGLTEAMNVEREQFGEERLMRAVERADGLDAGGVRERVLGEVKEFLQGVAPQDDMTVVVLRVH
jgi:serine phosphatase RsbU (regulator of sigma subunit)